MATIMSEVQSMEIIKRLSKENKDLKNRVDILEEILSNWLPIIEDKK